MYETDVIIYGLQCVIAPSSKRRVKTSRCKLLDWIYKKVYGYIEEPMLECDAIHIPWENKIIFKDKETLNRAKEIIEGLGVTNE